MTNMLDKICWLQAQNYDIFQIEESGAIPDLNHEQLAPFRTILASPRS
jgi:hypothetical protein